MSKDDGYSVITDGYSVIFSIAEEFLIWPVYAWLFILHFKWLFCVCVGVGGGCSCRLIGN